MAIRHGYNYFSCKGLKIVVDYWKEKGHEVVVLLPDYFFKEEEVERKKEREGNGCGKKVPDDLGLL